MLDKNTRWVGEEYQRRRYEEKKIHRRKKREAWKGLEEMEEAGMQKETKKFYMKVNITRKGYKPRMGMCKDKKGNLVTERKKVLQRRAEHIDELLNGHGDEDRNKGDGETEETGENLDKKKTRHMEQIETWKRRTYLHRRK
jgi:hypothetical protein